LIAREGYSTIAIVALVAIAVIVVTRELSLVPRVILIILAVDLLTMVVFFFRDPVRSLPEGVDPETVVVAPADGKILEIKDVEGNAYVGKPAKQLSIFLSVLDVHVNRIPVSGLVERLDYYPGEYLVAWNPKASELNERAEFGIMHPSGVRILFRQITGVLARRIVYHVQKGDQVKAGERFGIMKFGSRMDVLVPADFQFEVSVGERTVGGRTVLGHLKPASDD
jgi:phosphatidylserine decarboxylase